MERDRAARRRWEDREAFKKGDRIVFLGDSITQGGVGPKGYVTLFKAAIAEKYKGLGIEVIVGNPAKFSPTDAFCGALVQYPTTDGRVECYKSLTQKAHAVGALVVAACDPLALVSLVPPASWGADIAVGNSQRFGVPMGFGGPHAAFIATSEAYVRKLLGRIIGVSRDSHGNRALRIAMVACLAAACWPGPGSSRGERADMALAAGKPGEAVPILEAGAADGGGQLGAARRSGSRSTSHSSETSTLPAKPASAFSTACRTNLLVSLSWRCSASATSRRLKRASRLKKNQPPSSRNPVSTT